VSIGTPETVVLGCRKGFGVSFGTPETVVFGVSIGTPGTVVLGVPIGTPGTVVQKPLFLGCRLAPQEPWFLGCRCTPETVVASTNMHFLEYKSIPKNFVVRQGGLSRGRLRPDWARLGPISARYPRSGSTLTRLRAAPLSPVVGQSDFALRERGGGGGGGLT
jgi:hypothetical protein